MPSIEQKTHFPTCRHALWKLPHLWKSESVASHLLINDFHSCLEKPALKNALRLFHSSHSAGLRYSLQKRKKGTILLAEEDVDGGYGNPQKTRIPTATGTKKSTQHFLYSHRHRALAARDYRFRFAGACCRHATSRSIFLAAKRFGLSQTKSAVMIVELRTKLTGCGQNLGIANKTPGSTEFFCSRSIL